MTYRPTPADKIRTLIVTALCVAVAVPGILFGAMSKSKAITESHKIWGNYSYVQNGIQWGDTRDTYQIGYMSVGCADRFTIVGSGVGTWDAAFASLPPDKGIKGTYTGVQDLVSETPPGTVPTEVNRAVAPGVTIKVQFVLDGVPFAGPIDVVPNANGMGWTVRLPWDTTTVPNGNHYVCSRLIHADGSWQVTPAGMLLVQNP